MINYHQIKLKGGLQLTLSTKRKKLITFWITFFHKIQNRKQIIIINHY